MILDVHEEGGEHDDAKDARNELQDAPKQAKLLGLAADNEAAASELLLHKSEPVQVREDVGDNDLLEHLISISPEI